MNCPFCDIADGTLSAHEIVGSRSVVVFSDHQPVRPGHLQIVPRVHYSCFEDVPADVACEIVETAQRLAHALKQRHGVKRVGFVFTGHDIAHCHAHLIPLHAVGDVTSLRYFDLEDRPLAKRDLRVSEVELAAEAKAIRTALDGNSTHA